MPLYELVCIAAHNPSTNVSNSGTSGGEPNLTATSSWVPQKDLYSLVHNVASTVLRTGGVVRDIKNMGVRRLPQRMRRHQQYYTVGE